MAPNDSAQREPAPTEHPVAQYGLTRVLGAARLEAAGSGQPSRDGHLVEPYQGRQEIAHTGHSLGSGRPSASAPACVRAPSTRDSRSAHCVISSWRVHTTPIHHDPRRPGAAAVSKARTRRRARLRCTALPTLRPATMRQRVTPSRDGAMSKVRSGKRKRVALAKKWLMSFRRRRDGSTMGPLVRPPPGGCAPCGDGAPGCACPPSRTCAPGIRAFACGVCGGVGRCVSFLVTSCARGTVIVLGEVYHASSDLHSSGRAGLHESSVQAARPFLA